jgi:hypothetical protein
MTPRTLAELRRALHLERTALELAELEEQEARCIAERVIACGELYASARNTDERSRAIEFELRAGTTGEQWRVAAATTREHARQVDWLLTEIRIHEDARRERRLDLIERALDELRPGLVEALGGRE